MIFNTNKDRGRAGLSLAIAYFGANGYCVNLPLNDTQFYDLVVEKEGKFYTVQCKATGTVDNSISLRNTGGTKGKVYDNVCNHSNLDYLFCVDRNKNMFLIPVKDIISSGNHNSIHLVDKPISKFANKNCFDTYKYKVEI